LRKKGGWREERRVARRKKGGEKKEGWREELSQILYCEKGGWREEERVRRSVNPIPNPDPHPKQAPQMSLKEA
jgi:hypothetical protein